MICLPCINAKVDQQAQDCWVILFHWVTSHPTNGTFGSCPPSHLVPKYASSYGSCYSWLLPQEGRKRNHGEKNYFLSKKMPGSANFCSEFTGRNLFKGITSCKGGCHYKIVLVGFLLPLQNTQGLVTCKDERFL